MAHDEANTEPTEPRPERMFTRAEVDAIVERARKEGRASARRISDPDAAPFPLVERVESAAASDDRISRAIENGIKNGVARALEALAPPKPHPPLTGADIEGGADIDPWNLSPEDLDSIGFAGLRRLHEKILEASTSRPPAPNAANNTTKDK